MRLGRLVPHQGNRWRRLSKVILVSVNPSTQGCPVL